MKTRKLTQLDETIGVFKVIEDLGMVAYGDSQKCRRMARLLCPHCLKETTLLVDSAKRNKSCGCQKDVDKAKNSTKHGQHKTRLYRIWVGLRSRVNNPKTDYEKSVYGKLYVANEWNDFKVFREWAMANGYSDELQIDRKDNTKGYEPSNCRWVTKAQNTMNRMKGRINKELPKGVSKIKNRFRAKLTYKGEIMLLSYHSTVVSAQKAYNRCIDDNNLNEFYEYSK